MVRQVNLYEAKTSLSRLVDEAAKGEDIVIAKNGKPLARLTAVVDKPEKRVGGQWRHLMTPEERRDLGSAAWWKRWKEADAEILRDFEQSLNEDPRKFDSEWPATSSTPTRSSRSKQSPTHSGQKPAKRLKARKTRSS
jgi:prevent-host-death family protein